MTRSYWFLIGFHVISQFELDIQQASDVPAHDFKVQHATAGSSCSPLSKCFQLLDAYNRVNPQHEVITVLIDVTNLGGWLPSSQTDIENLITTYLGSSVIRPNDLVTACP